MLALFVVAFVVLAAAVFLLLLLFFVRFLMVKPLKLIYRGSNVFKKLSAVFDNRFGVFIVNFEHISHHFLLFILFILQRGGVRCFFLQLSKYITLLVNNSLMYSFRSE